MIFADKIIALRKKYGWSQEELAEKINVSRQAVSKWESAQSVPDLNKVLQLSELFGVTTDYLLKDELGEPEYTDSQSDSSATRKVTMVEANEYLDLKVRTSKVISTGALLCIISPICLLILSALSDAGAISLSEEFAAGIGIIALFLILITAVPMFIYCGFISKPYDFLENEVFETEYGVAGMVKERQKQFSDTYTRGNIIATCICIFSALPTLCGSLFSKNSVLIIAMVCATLLIAGIGVFIFIRVGVVWASFHKLLQEDDYTRENKTTHGLTEIVSSSYWLIVTAGYLLYSFITKNWADSWIVWPVAGVLYAAIVVICKAFDKTKK